MLGCLVGIVLLQAAGRSHGLCHCQCADCGPGLSGGDGSVGPMAAAKRSALVRRWLPLVGVVLAVVASALLLRSRPRLGPTGTPSWHFAGRRNRTSCLQTPVITAGEDPVDVSTTTPSDFPQFLGPQRNLIVTGIELDRDWVGTSATSVVAPADRGRVVRVQRGQRIRDDARAARRSGAGHLLRSGHRQTALGSCRDGAARDDLRGSGSAQHAND